VRSSCTDGVDGRKDLLLLEMGQQERDVVTEAIEVGLGASRTATGR
jgi:hypothetical protein